MYLVLIAWFYVAFMMAVAEATSQVGSVLGAVITFLLYGALPMAVLGYIMGTPARKRRRQAQEAAQQAQVASVCAPDAGSEAASHAITPVRKEP
jgi:mannose/fructose/N-acetylgalactosamine-specific phosphotransferase system component IID